MIKKKDVKTRLELPTRKVRSVKHSERDLILAESSAGLRGRRGKSFAKSVNDKIDVPFAFITNAQWEEIAKGTGFRRGIRNEINIALQKYWGGRLIDPGHLKKKIFETRKKIQQASAALDELVEDGSMFQGFIQGYERSYAEQRLDLETALEWMSVSTDYILADAERRFSSGKGKPAKYGRLMDLVHRLGAILVEFSSRRVDQGKTRITPGGITPLEFVWMVAQVADPDVSPGRVKNVVAQYLRDLKRAEVRELNSGNEMPFQRTKVYDDAESGSDED